MNAMKVGLLSLDGYEFLTSDDNEAGIAFNDPEEEKAYAADQIRLQLKEERHGTPA